MWSQLILPGMVSSFMRLPVEGLYCMIFPVRHWPAVSSWRKMMALSGVEAMR